MQLVPSMRSGFSGLFCIMVLSLFGWYLWGKKALQHRRDRRAYQERRRKWHSNKYWIMAGEVQRHIDAAEAARKAREESP